MTQAEVLDVFREALLVATKLAAPILIASIVVGLIVAIFQAATQIHEQTLTFVPKILVTALLMVVLGSWMLGQINDLIQPLFGLMAGL